MPPGASVCFFRAAKSTHRERVTSVYVAIRDDRKVIFCNFAKQPSQPSHKLVLSITAVATDIMVVTKNDFTIMATIPSKKTAVEVL